VNVASFSRDGNYIVSGSESDVLLWDSKTGDSLWDPLRTTSNVLTVAFSPNSKRIAAGLADGTILLITVRGQMVVPPIKHHKFSALSVSFSPDGRRLVSGYTNNCIRILDAQSGINILGPTYVLNMYSVAFSGDGKRIVVAECDNLVVIDAKSGQTMWRSEAGAGIAYSAAFSVDKPFVVSLPNTSTSHVWIADTGLRVKEPYEEGALAVGFISGVSCRYPGPCISPDGKWVVAYVGEGVVSVWHSKTKLLAATYQSHTDSVKSIAFSADSRRIVTASADQTIQIHTLDV